MFQSIFYGWWVILACWLITLYVGACASYGFTAMFDPIVKEFGWSYTEVSFASSLQGLEMGFLSPIVGVLVDRFGPRKLILTGVITIGTGLILLSLTQSLWMFYASFILLSFGAGGCTSIVTLVVVARWFRRNLGKAMGITVSGYGASGLLLPVVVWLIDSYGWRSAMVIQGVGMWVLGIPLALLIRNQPEEMGLLPDGSPLSNLKTTNLSRKTEIPDLQIPFRDALRSRSFIYLTLLDTLRMAALMAVITHVMPYLSVEGISRGRAGLVAGAIPLFSVLGRFGFGWMGDVVEKRYVIAMCFFCMAAGLGAFQLAATLWPFILLLFLFLFSPGSGGSMVMRGVVIREYFGGHSFGKLLGITMGVSSIGGFIGPTLAGWVFDASGTYSQLWIAFAIMLFLAMFISLGVRRVAIH